MKVRAVTKSLSIVIIVFIPVFVVSFLAFPPASLVGLIALAAVCLVACIAGTAGVANIASYLIAQAPQRAKQSRPPNQVTPPKKAEIATYVEIAAYDPPEGLVALRREIMERLEKLAQLNQLTMKNDPKNLVTTLRNAGIISASEEKAMLTLWEKLNRAVYGGRTVDDGDVVWAIEIGGNILASLDEKIKSHDK